MQDGRELMHRCTDSERGVPIPSSTKVFEDRNKRLTEAFNMNPLEYLGEDNNPFLEEVQTRRNASKKLYNDIVNPEEC